jgi:tRNA A-37 threonylcarbamoyl transferase component Bud32
VGATVADDSSEGGFLASGGACRPGETLSGRYRIVRFIARGASGAVYEADDLVVGTPVALKVLHPERATSSTAIERLHRELALARRITHRNVCRLHDVGEDAGRIFLTMELLDGETLAERIARGPINVTELDMIAEQLVAALGAAHAEGVVHRDFKPQNVILVDARVVVTDFGLARSTVDEDDVMSLTADTAMIGTPAYMAPEQVEGRDATAASDVYALGVVLFELATGKPPFREATGLATATARLHRDPPRIVRADLDPRWRAVIARCLARDPAARFPTAHAVLDARHRRARRSRISMVLVAGVLAATSIGSIAFVSRTPATARAIDQPLFFPPKLRPASTSAARMFDQANAALAIGDREAARTHLETAAASSPDDPIAQAGLAELLGELGYRERAEEANRRATRSRSALDGEALAYVNAVDTSFRDPAARIAALEALVASAPAQASYRERLVTAYVLAAKPERARTALDNVLLAPFEEAMLEAAIAGVNSETMAALAHGIHAMNLAPPDSRRNDHARALVVVGEARYRLGDVRGAKRELRRALSLGDVGVQLRARANLASIEHAGNDLLAGANEYAAQAALLRTVGDRARLASVLMDGATQFAEAGEPDTAESMIAEARVHAMAISSAVELAWVDAQEARIASWRGQLERARTLAERAYHAGLAVGRPGIVGNSFFTWTMVLLEHDDPIALSKMRALRTETIERIVDCVAALREGDLDRAERIANTMKTLETYEGRMALMVLAQVAILRGRLDEGDEILERIEANLRVESNSLVVRERVEHAHAMLGVKRGNTAEALARLDGYIARTAKAGLALAETRSLGVAAVLAIEAKRPDAAQRAATAIARAGELGMRRTGREVRDALAR